VLFKVHVLSWSDFVNAHQNPSQSTYLPMFLQSKLPPQKLIPLFHSSNPSPSRILTWKCIEKMLRTLRTSNTALDALGLKRRNRLPAHAARDQIIVGAVHDESRGAIIPALDLGIRAYGGDLLRAGHWHVCKGFGVAAGEGLLGGEAVDEDGDHLRFPVHVQDDAPALVGKAHHEGAWGAFVEGWGVACKLDTEKALVPVDRYKGGRVRGSLQVDRVRWREGRNLDLGSRLNRLGKWGS